MKENMSEYRLKYHTYRIAILIYLRCSYSDVIYVHD